MTTYKEFLGLNYCIYEPILDDEGAEGDNTLGYSFLQPYTYSDAIGANPNITPITRHNKSQTMVLLNLHRNGPYGYPMWKQIRASENHLSRAHRKKNIFTYVEEPGSLLGSRQSRFGNIQSFTEPVVVDSYKPVSLIGGISVYNEKLNEFQQRSVELKTSFGNETAFFANSKVNDYFETIAETDENYEQLKDLYLDGGLEDEGSPIDSFNMFVYRQSIYPKQQYAYLDETRSRKYYVNTFWRSKREDRTQLNVDNGFGTTVPYQSMWPLDAREDFETRTMPVKNISHLTDDVFDFDIGGKNADNAESAPGILQNRFSSFTLGGRFDRSSGHPHLFNTLLPPPAVSVDNLLTSSVCYSRLHTLKNYYSPINPSGPKIHTTRELLHDREAPTAFPFSNDTGSIFNGTAVWDAPRQANKEPFYDSYSLFGEETRVKAKGFTKIPEFRISSHVNFYLKNSIKSELENIFEISGALGQDNATTELGDFFQILSNSDFLRHFNLVKSDHKDLARESAVKITCKAVKKFLPYKGFYPADRCVDVAKQFYDSYREGIQPPRNLGPIGSVDLGDYETFASKAVLEPLFSPGILFNTIKSGIAVDWPLIIGDDYVSEDVQVNGDNFVFSTRVNANDFGEGPLFAASTSQAIQNNVLIGHTNNSKTVNNYKSIYSTRIPFEALIDPASYLANKELVLQEPHDFALGETQVTTKWTGTGDPLYRKMISNFLAEVPDFFLTNEGFKSISSLEEQSPEFGNALSGNFYVMRVKMTKSRNKSNLELGGYDGISVVPPQDVVDQSGNPGTNPGDGDDKFTTRETLTMYSRPTAFGPPTIGDGKFRTGATDGLESRLGSTWGYNFPYTPPYYHGDSWCDLIFYAKETKKYSLDEIISQAKQYPYYTRFWSPSYQDALRDLTGYENGSTSDDGIYSDYFSSGDYDPPWSKMIHELSSKGTVTIESYEDSFLSDQWIDAADLSNATTLRWGRPAATETFGGVIVNVEAASWLNAGPQSGFQVNNNAMQLDSSVNIFGKGTVKKIKSKIDGSEFEVSSGETVKGKTRWVIQPKFETPILNFNKYNNLSDPSLKCTEPKFAKSQVPRGMWHQYGDLPAENEGIYLQVSDIPDSWLRGALGVTRSSRKIKSLADLVGFSKEPVRLGEVADVKEISEAVVAVPFIEKDGTRQFFSIPREDIDSCINSALMEASPGNFTAGQTPKAGDSVYQMVKKMQKYVFPPSMDFVRYKEIDPFAMYIFEFKHNLTKQDLADIWQNLPPEIGTRMEEAEATISHELLAHELLGGGAVVKNGVLDDNAEGNGIPSNIQWMIFKAKKRAKTNYFDKVVAKKGTTEDTSSQQLENAQGQTGDDLGVTYNWPYDFFSLVELVKIDAEVTFANIENDDKGQKTIKKVEKKNPLEVSKTRAAARGINIARGKGKPKK